MPRPSKRVAPDTLGGRLRTARQNLHLSLADVAGHKYSTSLISQIERNRVDPSTESLQYLAERLQLPYDDLQVLARQHRESETEANLYREYEAKYAEINLLLARRQPALALTHFNDKAFKLDQLPLFLRWRTLALRGQAYFEQREFSKAQRDFQSALTIMPAPTSMPPEEHQLEIIKLHLHMAEATRELNQFEQALEYYRDALNTMDSSTALRYIAEAHWGIALVYYNQGRNALLQDGEKSDGQGLLQEAWQHAEDARGPPRGAPPLPERERREEHRGRDGGGEHERQVPDERRREVVEEAVRRERVRPGVPEVVPDERAVADEERPVQMNRRIPRSGPDRVNERRERSGQGSGEHQLTAAGGA